MLPKITLNERKKRGQANGGADGREYQSGREEFNWPPKETASDIKVRATDTSLTRNNPFPTTNQKVHKSRENCNGPPVSTGRVRVKGQLSGWQSPAQPGQTARLKRTRLGSRVTLLPPPPIWVKRVGIFHLSALLGFPRNCINIFRNGEMNSVCQTNLKSSEKYETNCLHKVRRNQEKINGGKTNISKMQRRGKISERECIK